MSIFKEDRQILIIDGDDNNSELYFNHLSDQKFDIFFTRTLHEAIETINQNHEPHVIIVNCSEHKGGPDIIRELRDYLSRKVLVVAFLSQEEYENNRQQLTKRGVGGFLLKNTTKPVFINQLNALIQLRDFKIKAENNAYLFSLKNKKDDFPDIIKEAPIPIMIHAGGKVLQLSDSWTFLSGYSLDEIPDIKTWTKKAYPDNAEHMEKFIHSLYNITESQFDGERQIVTKDGITRIWEFFTSPLGEKSTGETILSSMAVDVTHKKEVEEKLKASESHLRNIIENSTNLFYIYNTQHQIKYVSPKINSILGYSPSEVQQKKWTSLLTNHPVNKQGITIHNKAIKTGKSQAAYPLQFKHKNGNIIWGEIREVPVHVNGKTVEVVGSFNDTTQQREFEIIRNRFFDLSLHLVAVLNNEGMIIDLNNGWQNILGHSKNNSVNRNIKEFMHPEDLPVFINSLNTLSTKSVDVHFNCRLKSKKNVYHLLKWSIALEPDFNHIYAIAIDISEEHRVKTKLEWNIKKYEKLFESVSDAIFLVDNQTNNILEANRAASKLYGFSYNEFTRLKSEMLIDSKMKAPDFPSPVKRPTDPAAINTLAYHKKKDGTVFPVEVTGRSFKHEKKNVSIWAIRDISVQIEANKKLKEYQEGLEKMVEQRTAQLTEQNERLLKSQKAMSFLVEDVNEARQEVHQVNERLKIINAELEAFSYSVSHDLRAPINRIEGFSDALVNHLGSTLDDKGKHYINRIKGAVELMGNLIASLLQLSRITRIKINRKDINISQLVEKVANELLLEDGFKHVNIKIQPDIMAYCDAELARILLDNVIKNALKYSAVKTEPQVEFGQVTEKNKTVFFVSDNGVGFDMNQYDKLFTPFSRLHTNNEFEGTGIGLATVQRIVFRHGGKVWAKSEQNKGATFYFNF